MKAMLRDGLDTGRWILADCRAAIVAPLQVGLRWLERSAPLSTWFLLGLGAMVGIRWRDFVLDPSVRQLGEQVDAVMMVSGWLAPWILAVPPRLSSYRVLGCLVTMVVRWHLVLIGMAIISSSLVPLVALIGASWRWLLVLGLVGLIALPPWWQCWRTLLRQRGCRCHAD